MSEIFISSTGHQKNHAFLWVFCYSPFFFNIFQSFDIEMLKTSTWINISIRIVLSILWDKFKSEMLHEKHLKTKNQFSLGSKSKRSRFQTSFRNPKFTKNLMRSNNHNWWHKLLNGWALGKTVDRELHNSAKL